MIPVVMSIALGVGLCGQASDGPPVEATKDLVLYTGPFVPVPGHLELSGRLLVRPRQWDFTQATVPSGAIDNDLLARSLIAPYVIEHVDELDIYIVEVPPGSTEDSYAAELLSTGLYESVNPDWVHFPLGTPNDPDYPVQWHLAKINARSAWRFTQGSPNVAVAFVDTGVDLTHPDLAGVLVPGYNSYWGSRKAQIDGGKVSDDNGHGTSVAGAAIAIANNSFGGCGVAWSLRIMPIRTTNPNNSSGGASSGDIMNGALWAANHGAKVVNISFSGVGESFAETLGAQLRTKGSLLVWPMDTLGIATTFNHPNVVVVNGTDSTDQAYGPADWGPGVDLGAPGVGLWIPVKGGTYAWQTGNSFAAPIVAASAGLVWSVDVTLLPSDIELALEYSALDIGATGIDPYFGHGLVDPYLAVVAVIIGQIGHANPPRHMLWSVLSDDRLSVAERWHVP